MKGRVAGGLEAMQLVCNYDTAAEKELPARKILTSLRSRAILTLQRRIGSRLERFFSSVNSKMPVSQKPHVSG